MEVNAMDLYNAMKQARKYYAEKNYENALEILQQCFDFAKQEYCLYHSF